MAYTHTGKNQWRLTRPPNLAPPLRITRPHRNRNRNQNGCRRCVEWIRSWEERKRWLYTRSSSSETITRTCRFSKTPRLVFGLWAPGFRDTSFPVLTSNLYQYTSSSHICTTSNLLVSWYQYPPVTQKHVQ